MTLVLREGYDAMAAAAVDCGCRFFAGYPMLPFTGLLDAFARELPRTGGVLRVGLESGCRRVVSSCR